MSLVSGRMIPNFIKARSPQGLRLLMLKTNSQNGKHYQYFDIQYVKEAAASYWIAWYFDEVTLENVDKLDQELSNGSEK
jgi:hypothetical protein